MASLIVVICATTRGKLAVTVVAVVGYDPTPSKRLVPQMLALAFVCVKILMNVTLSFEENFFHLGYAMFLPGFEEKKKNLIFTSTIVEGLLMFIFLSSSC